MYVYIENERGTLWTVGFYKSIFHGQGFIPESDHTSARDAARRVHYLNGGNDEASSWDNLNRS